MASVFKKQMPNGTVSPFWYASYRRADGTWTKKTTKTTKRKVALDIANKLEKAEALAERGALTVHRTRELLAEVTELATGETLERYTTRSWIETWLSNKRGAKRTGGTVARYEGILNAFLDFLGKRADLPLEALRVSDITRYRDHIGKAGRSPSTVNLSVKIVRMPLNAAANQGLVPFNPAAATNVQSIEEDNVEKGIFTAEQLTKLLASATGDWHGLILIAFYTGLRLGDAAALTWGQIDLAESVIALKRQRKTKKPLTQPLHPAVEAHLLELQSSDDPNTPVFPSLAGLKVPGKTGLSCQFIEIMEAAGIERSRIDNGGRAVYDLSFHSLRHSFNSMMANAGISQEVRRALTGHSSDRMNDRYTHHDLDILREAMAELPSIT